jgi:phosphatidate phosphatase PAH1
MSTTNVPLDQIDFSKPANTQSVLISLTRQTQEAERRANKAEEGLAALQSAKSSSSQSSLYPPTSSTYIKPFKGLKFTGDLNSPDLDEFLDQLSLQISCQNLADKQQITFLRTAISGTAFQELRAQLTLDPHLDYKHATRFLRELRPFDFQT